MRLTQFEAAEATYQTRRSLYSWNVVVHAYTRLPIMAFDDDTVIIRFPILNATLGNTRHLLISDDGQINFQIDIALYANNEEAAIHEIENAAIMEVASKGTSMISITDFSIILES